MSSTPEPESVPPGVVGTPQGAVPFIAYPATQDYPRLVFSAPRFETVAIADIIQPSVTEAVQAILPSLVPPYVNQAALDAVNALAVRRVGDTMTGPLNLSPAIPTAPTMAATKQYVDTMVATSVPEVPPVPAGQSWMRQTGQWVPSTGGGTVTNIATGAGLTGGPITGTGTIAMANMAANSLKGNNTGAVASPTDIPAGTVLTMIGAAPLNSPNFTGSPSLPTGTVGVTQPAPTNNTTLATTAFVATAIAAAPAGVQSFNTRTGAVTLLLADVTGVGGAPLASPGLTGNPTGPTPAVGNSSASLATTAFVAASFAPLASPVFTGTPNLPTGAFGVTQSAGTSNTSLATTAFVATAVGSIGINVVDNSGFTVNQRAYTSGAALGAGAFGFDRWKGGAAGATLTFTAAPPSTTVTITAGSLQQVVSGNQLLTGSYALSWTGTATGRVGAGAYAASPVAVSATAGTNLTIEFQSGTLGRVQLQMGTVATPWQPLGEATELERCQRRYTTGVFSVTAASGGAGIGFTLSQSFPTTLAGTPAMVVLGESVVGVSPRSLTASAGGGGFVINGTVTSAVGTGYVWNGTYSASSDI